MKGAHRAPFPIPGAVAELQRDLGAAQTWQPGAPDRAAP